ncbi:Low-density lipoprotein receptor-related protein 4 [Thelohanellus kitauei]|uniref:Low-density lipoprotein receptor-related protein 4 n=1 Tax=Thelohanellus kitauei TaxID=669202 RepID=A0A0C2JVL3_THEKT|nr:Low-density lipoprotein receptor-related protein 4 [Thelohanellus kitauei]
MLNGGHLPKQNTIEVVLNKKVNLNHSMAFDHTQRQLFTYVGKYITKFHMASQRIEVLYFQNDTIVDMVYDPISHALIYLTDRKQLKLLSLLSSYEYVVSDHVSWFTYSAHHRLLSMVMSANYFCYCELLESPTCIRSSLDLLQSFVDIQNSRVFLLTKTNLLMVKKFVRDPTSLQPLTEVHDVSHFEVYDDNLYYLMKGQLLYRNLKHNNLDVMLIKNVTFNSLKLHRESSHNYKNTCEGLSCPFFCQPIAADDVSCGCPPPTIPVDKTCICPKSNPNCKMPQCVGFQCKNSKCLLNNVRCNGVNDCGDNSDEIGCEDKCSSGTHLCGTKCLIKDAVCGPVEITVIDTVATIIKKRSRSYIVLIIRMYCYDG